MSTRGNYHFCWDGKVQANIYVHFDNYPDREHGGFSKLNHFFDKCEKLRGSMGGTRFNDPFYLSTKFVVFISQMWDNQFKQPSLDFLNVGVMLVDAGDAEYVYKIHCDNDDRPKIECFRMYDGRQVNEKGNLIRSKKLFERKTKNYFCKKCNADSAFFVCPTCKSHCEWKKDA